MKFKGTKLSKRTIALFAAALVLLGAGGVTGTRAVPTVLGDTFDTQIETPILAVALTENGNTLGDGATLFEKIGDKVEPGKEYVNPIGVVNTGNTDEYIRVVVRKYWTEPKTTEEGKKTDSGKKDTKLTPDLIILDEAGGWTVKDGESDETKVYYYASPVAANDKVKLFNSVKISNTVATNPKITQTPAGDGVTIVTYTYEYDGYTFHVEAEAQGVQTHNAKDAIKSVWGVDAASVGINL